MTLITVETLSIAGEAGSGRAVVAEAAFSLTKGQTLGIAGESGCGKSTLLLALMGIVKPGLVVTGGGVRLAGTEVLTAPAEARRRLRGPVVALVPQSAAMALTPTMRVGAQLLEAMEVHGHLAEKDRTGRVKSLFARVRLPDPDGIGERYPHELSGGQMQRVAIAMALSCAPQLLLLDEPTSAMDYSSEAQLKERLRHYAQHKTMIIVTHRSSLMELADRIIVLDEGKVVADGPKDKVMLALQSGQVGRAK